MVKRTVKVCEKVMSEQTAEGGDYWLGEEGNSDKKREPHMQRPGVKRPRNRDESSLEKGLTRRPRTVGKPQKSLLFPSFLLSNC